MSEAEVTVVPEAGVTVVPDPEVAVVPDAEETTMSEVERERSKIINSRVLGRSEKLQYLETWMPEGHVEALEIGPSVAPLLHSSESLNVRYMESDNTDSIRDRATLAGKDPELVPEISFVYDPAKALQDVVGEQSLDVVASSHMIEHTRDLLGHLKEVHASLRPGGRYLLVVPDKLLCSDICRPASTLGQVMACHMTGTEPSVLASQIDSARYRVFRHDGRGWWNSNDISAKAPKGPWLGAVQRVIDDPDAASNEWMGHNWVFTADSFADLMIDLVEMGELNMGLVDILPSGHMDFMAVLERREAPFNTKHLRQRATNRLHHVAYPTGDRRFIN